MQTVASINPTSLVPRVGTMICLWLNGSVSAERPLWYYLWSNAKLRFATDGATNRILEAGLRLPDIVSGDMDSISDFARAFVGEKGVDIVVTEDQNYTDMAKSLNLISHRINEDKEQAYGPIIVLGGLSGRFDHTLSTLNSLLDFQSRSNSHTEIYSLDGNNLVGVLMKGTTKVDIDRSLLTGKCGYVPFCQRKTIVSTSGFKWNLDKQEMKYGGVISTSNEVCDDLLVISTSTPLILTMELRDSFVGYQSPNYFVSEKF